MMDGNKNNEKNHFVDAITRDIFSPTEPPELGETQLWAYALNILEPVEQDQVMEMIAKSEKAQHTLARIRESISVAGAAKLRPEMSSLESARVKARNLLAAMGKELSSITAVIVEMNEGFMTAFLQAGYDSGKLVPQTVRLGDEESKRDISKTYSSCVEIKSPEGLNLSIVRVPDRGTDIYVEVTNPPFDGKVTLFKLLTANGVVKEENTGIEVRLKDRKVRLEDCPYGILKVVAPGDRSIKLCLEPGSQQA